MTHSVIQQKRVENYEHIFVIINVVTVNLNLFMYVTSPVQTTVTKYILRHHYICI
jgi:hypothetical protein